jgi:hypothetical protein
LLDVRGANLVTGGEPGSTRILGELRAERADLDDEQAIDRSADAQEHRKRAVSVGHGVVSKRRYRLAGTRRSV